MTCSARWEFESRWSAPSGTCRTRMRSATTSRGSVDFSSSRVTRDSVACRESCYREPSVHGKSCGTSGTSQKFSCASIVGSRLRPDESLDSQVVLYDHLTSTGQELFGKGTRLARLQIHVDSGQHGDRGDLIGLLVPHLVKEPDDLLSHFEDPGSDRNDIPGAQLPFVRGILLDPRHSAIVLAQERGCKAQRREQMPGGLVELADVPHHVHLSHVVALPRIDGATIGDR